MSFSRPEEFLEQFEGKRKELAKYIPEKLSLSTLHINNSMD
jgi:hypothetical protein